MCVLRKLSEQKMKQTRLEGYWKEMVEAVCEVVWACETVDIAVGRIIEKGEKKVIVWKKAFLSLSFLSFLSAQVLRGTDAIDLA